MEALNQWLNEIQHNGTGLDLYFSTGTVCMALLCVAILWYIWRQRLNPIKGIVIGCLAYLFMGYAQHLMTWYRRDFALDAYEGTANIGYAMILLPLFCWLCDWVFNVQRGTSGELVAVSTMAWHWVGRSGCTFSGCCYGIPCSWGIYSHYPNANTFPVCWVESMGTLAILIFLLMRICRRGYMPQEEFTRSRVMNWYCRKRRLPDNGRALPYTLLCYGGMRMVTEFLRYHAPDHVWFGFLPDTFILAFLMALVGGFLLYRNIRKSKAAEAPEEPQLPKIKANRR